MLATCNGNLTVVFLAKRRLNKQELFCSMLGEIKLTYQINIDWRNNYNE